MPSTAKMASPEPASSRPGSSTTRRLLRLTALFFGHPASTRLSILGPWGSLCRVVQPRPYCFQALLPLSPEWGFARSPIVSASSKASWASYQRQAPSCHLRDAWTLSLLIGLLRSLTGERREHEKKRNEKKKTQVSSEGKAAWR